VASQYGTLQECITAIRQDLRTLPGLRPLLDEVPDAVNAYPAIVVYPIGMNWKLGSHSGDRGKGMRMGMYTIGIELIVARKDLARDVALLMEFCESLPDHLFAGFSRDKYGDTVLQLGNPSLAQNATWPIRIAMVPSSWGDDTTLAWRCEFDVATNREINV
jgi:hypothetical protein